jgi:hypothetical protein
MLIGMKKPLKVALSMTDAEQRYILKMIRMFKRFQSGELSEIDE